MALNKINKDNTLRVNLNEHCSKLNVWKRKQKLKEPWEWHGSENLLNMFSSIFRIKFNDFVVLCNAF